jgi:hypothetical protein
LARSLPPGGPGHGEERRHRHCAPALDAIEVYDGATLVGTDTAYVVGLRDVPPGSSAAFSSYLNVVGRADDPTWRVVINAHAGEVKYASPKVRSMGFSRVDGGYPELG